MLAKMGGRMELEAGTLVTPNVRLVKLLGKGGMGSVWVADHETLYTQVAVKFISVDLAQRDSNLTERFSREASLAAKIKSPHVVQTFDHGVMDDGTPFIVMELLEGESLGARLARTGALSLRETAKLVAQVAEVLSTAHGMGVVHRDIKPDNLFLINTGYEIFVKVLDFGVAKQTQLPDQHAMTTTGAMVGTPFYMSPELIQSAKSADSRADIWALGVVAYEAMTGRVPFLGETIGSLCIAIASTDFVPASRKRQGVPPTLDSWFDQVFARDSSQRFATAKAMAEALKAITAEVEDMGQASTEPKPPQGQGFTLESRPPPEPGHEASAPPPAPVQASVPSDHNAPTHVSGAPPPGAGPPDLDSVPPHGTIPTPMPGYGPDDGSAPPAGSGALAASSPPTLEGAARSMDEMAIPKKRGGAAFLVAAALLVAGALVAFIVLRSHGDEAQPAASDETTELAESDPSASAPAEATTPEATAVAGDSPTDDDDAGAPPARASTRTPTKPPATRPPSSATKTTTKPPAATATTTQSKRNCYYKTADGKTAIRPECL